MSDGTINIGVGNDVAISSHIVGTGGFTKIGGGELILSGDNSYSGTTTLNAGLLDIESATALGTGPLVINGGGLANDQSATSSL